MESKKWYKKDIFYIILPIIVILFNLIMIIFAVRYMGMVFKMSNTMSSVLAFVIAILFVLNCEMLFRKYY